MRLRVLIVDLLENSVEVVYPMVAGEWAVTWAPNDVLLVCGVPDGDRRKQKDPAHVIYAYVVGSDRKFITRAPSKEEKAIVRKVFAKKYGHQPKV